MGPSSKWKYGTPCSKSSTKLSPMSFVAILSVFLTVVLIFYWSTWSLGHRDIWGWVRPSQALRGPPYTSAHRARAPDPTACSTDAQAPRWTSAVIAEGRRGAGRWLRTYPGEAGRQRWRQKEAVCLGGEAVGPWLVLHCPVWLDLQNSNSKRQLTTSRWWPQSIKPQGGVFWVWVLVKIA